MAIEEAVINDDELLDKLGRARESLLREIRKAIIGQDDVVEQVLLSLFVGGHSIITGVPGLAKTLLVRTLSGVLDLSFKRIQFTPDLMPADITGTEIIEEDRATGHRALQFIRGPIFANIVLALITGAAGGIGIATAQRLASEGACVVMCDVDSGALAEATTALQSSAGNDAVA